MAYDGDRSDALALDQLEAILRLVAEELAGWRGRALKAEGEAKDAPRGATAAKPDVEARGRAAELEQENRALRQRVEGARVRVHDLLARLSFLEEQARESGASGPAVVRSVAPTGGDAAAGRGIGGGGGPGGTSGAAGAR